jgi:predicted DNA-binding mobile mystery protein A
MKTPRVAAQARARLDKRFKALAPATAYSQPPRGWTRAVREALGMTTAQLAKRVGVKQPSIVAMEQSEARGTIEVATLRRVAEALDCRLVYALVPNKPLEETVRERALTYARRRLDPIEHSMAMEDQKVTRKKTDALIDEIMRETNPRRLWDEP